MVILMRSVEYVESLKKYSLDYRYYQFASHEIQKLSILCMTEKYILCNVGFLIKKNERYYEFRYVNTSRKRRRRRSIDGYFSWVEKINIRDDFVIDEFSLLLRIKP